MNSQIAGQIKANANLKGNAANLIINEVTGSNRSELQGKLEVAGKGANVLIANPNGITCNGCSFVNTPCDYLKPRGNLFWITRLYLRLR